PSWRSECWRRCGSGRREAPSPDEISTTPAASSGQRGEPDLTNEECNVDPKRISSKLQLVKRGGGRRMNTRPYRHARTCTWRSRTVEHRRIGSDGIPRVIVRDPETGALLLHRCSCWKPLAHASQRLRPRRRRWTLMDAVLCPPSGTPLKLVAAAHRAASAGRN